MPGTKKLQMLPAYFKHLNLLCRNYKAHPLPVKMKYITMQGAPNGIAYAVYVCPFPKCRYREKWTQSRQHGRPKKM